jgi:hypothetical protein
VRSATRAAPVIRRNQKALDRTDDVVIAAMIPFAL